MERLTKEEIRRLIETDLPHITPHQRDEMAIPTYLHRNPLIRWLMWQRYVTIAPLLGTMENGTVLEFGCGIGLFLPELSRRCRQPLAIDLFPDYAELLNNKLNLGVQFLRSIDECPSGSLDAIIAADVLEHVDDLQGLIRQFHLKLAERGTLIISGPTENLAYKIGRFFAGFSGKADYHHTDIDDIIQVATRCGFEVRSLQRLPSRMLPCLFKVCTFSKS